MFTQFGRIADELAGALMGLILAAIVAFALDWLWPEMRVVGLIVFVVFWVMTSISTAIVRRNDLVRTSSSGWESVDVTEADKELPFKDWIWGEIAFILFGAVAGFLVGGISGTLLSVSRWPGFCIFFLLWATLSIGTISDRRRPW